MKTIDHSKQELKNILEELKSPKKKGVLKGRIPIEKRQSTESGTKNTEKEENNLKEKTQKDQNRRRRRRDESEHRKGREQSQGEDAAQKD
jgi:hypothetical protein